MKGQNQTVLSKTTENILVLIKLGSENVETFLQISYIFSNFKEGICEC